MTTAAEQGAIERMEKRLDDLFTLIGDVRERLSYMEGRATHAAVEALKAELDQANARIANLESAHNIRNGVTLATKTWAEWIHRLAPWGFAVALVVWNYFRPPH